MGQWCTTRGGHVAEWSCGGQFPCRAIVMQLRSSHMGQLVCIGGVPMWGGCMVAKGAWEGSGHEGWQSGMAERCLGRAVGQ